MLCYTVDRLSDLNFENADDLETGLQRILHGASQRDVDALPTRIYRALSATPYLLCLLCACAHRRMCRFLCMHVRMRARVCTNSDREQAETGDVKAREEKKDDDEISEGLLASERNWPV